jgi:hypothetical protein
MNRAESQLPMVLCTAAELGAVFSFLRLVLHALLLLLSILSCCLWCAAPAVLPHHQNSLGLNPLRRPFHTNVAKPSSIPPSQRPHANSHPLPPPPKRPPNPPSQSGPLHPTRPSRSKHEWLCAGFRLSGQRVFCAYSRRALLHQLASTCRSPVHSIIF